MGDFLHYRRRTTVPGDCDPQEQIAVDYNSNVTVVWHQGVLHSVFMKRNLDIWPI